MYLLHFNCPNCGAQFTINGYWKWVFQTPFHWFGKRKTKCPYCEKKSYMKWFAITRE